MGPIILLVFFTFWFSSPSDDSGGVCNSMEYYPRDFCRFDCYRNSRWIFRLLSDLFMMIISRFYYYYYYSRLSRIVSESQSRWRQWVSCWVGHSQRVWLYPSGLWLELERWLGQMGRAYGPALYGHLPIWCTVDHPSSRCSITVVVPPLSLHGCSLSLFFTSRFA